MNLNTNEIRLINREELFDFGPLRGDPERLLHRAAVLRGQGVLFRLRHHGREGDLQEAVSGRGQRRVQLRGSRVELRALAVPRVGRGVITSYSIHYTKLYDREE